METDTTVVVRGAVSGNVLVGPAQFPIGDLTAYWKIMQMLRDSLEGLDRVRLVRLFHGARELHATDTVDDVDFLEVTAVFELPMPLTRLMLQQVAFLTIGLDPDETDQCAAELYENECCSYPRTESSAYDQEHDFEQDLNDIQASGTPLLQQIDHHPNFRGSVSEKARQLLQEYEPPRHLVEGADGLSSDGGYAPIHPMFRDHLAADRYSQNAVAVYEILVRHFMAIVSGDLTLLDRQ